MDSGVIVYKYDIVVKQEYVKYEHTELHKECHKETDETRWLRPFIVIVELEEVAFEVLVCHVDHTNDKKVETGGNSPPSDELANFYREAADV